MTKVAAAVVCAAVAAEEAGHLACPPVAKELLAIAVTAEKQQQRKQLHKQRQVALQLL